MAKEILIIKHIGIEGPGSIGEVFENTAWDIREINLDKCEKFPDNFSDIEAIISLGGPMNVYEEDKFPFLKEEDIFLRKAIKENIPILGICLGAQILAKACAAKIQKAKTKEIGWYNVSLTKVGRMDPLFLNLPKDFTVFQWHEDTFEIPKGAQRLAESESCPNQAFRFGGNSYGMQFHIEVTPDMVESWVNKYAKDAAGQINGKDMVIEAYKRKESFRRQADLIYLNFARVIRSS